MEGNSFLYGAERLALEDGTCLRLLSAWEALEAHREAEALAQGGRSGPCAPTPACWPGRWSGTVRRCSRAGRRSWRG